MTPELPVTPFVTVPAELETLDVGKARFGFEAVHGFVKGTPTMDGYALELFFEDSQTGRDRLVRFDSKENALPGHEVTFIYARDLAGGDAFPVAWANHSIQRMEYFTEATRARFEGRAGKAMTALGTAGSASVSDLSGRHGGLMNLLILPITLGIALVSLIVGLFGGAVSGQNRQTGEAILARASDIFAKGSTLNAPRYTARTSPLKWVLIIGGLLLAASIVMPLINFALVYLSHKSG